MTGRMLLDLAWLILREHVVLLLISWKQDQTLVCHLSIWNNLNGLRRNTIVEAGNEKHPQHYTPLIHQGELFSWRGILFPSVYVASITSNGSWSHTEKGMDSSVWHRTGCLVKSQQTMPSSSARATNWNHIVYCSKFVYFLKSIKISEELHLDLSCYRHTSYRQSPCFTWGAGVGHTCCLFCILL